ncbi:MAG: acetyl-coenzyme A synthetase N-terminal domain-containing protein, partial [Pseudomonadota bacterium]
MSSVEEFMTEQENTVFESPQAFAQRANLSPARYAEMYAASVSDPDAFWAEHGQRLDWITPYTKVKNTNWS